MNNVNILQDIFNQIQECDSKIYSENIKMAVKLIPMDDSFIKILHLILICKSATLPARISLFMKRVFEELMISHSDIVEGILNYLVSFTNCKSAKCRKRALNIINLIIQVGKTDLKSDLLQIITEHLFDKDTSVRKEALNICLLKQNDNINETLKIQGVIKDVLRYDPNIEIRKMALSRLEVSKSTINCIIERSIDCNMKIRRIFWIHCFPKIQIDMLKYEQRIFLMKNARNEREFDAKSIFLELIFRIGILKFIEYFYYNDPVFDIFIEEYLKNNKIEFKLDKFDNGYLYFLRKYYKYTEDNFGRDKLSLIDLEDLLGMIYDRFKELEDSMNNETKEIKPDLISPDKISSNSHQISVNSSDQNQLKFNQNQLKFNQNQLKSDQIGLNDSNPDIKKKIGIIVELFKLLSFYDIFKGDVKHMVLKIISYLLSKCYIPEIVEESIIICKKISNTDENIIFFRKIISKIKGKKSCFLVCEYIMKHLDFGILHQNIFTEIVIPNLSESSNILFWYYLKQPSNSIEELYLSFLPGQKFIEGATDLVLSNILDVTKISELIYHQLNIFDINAVVPTTKLILGNKVPPIKYIKQLLIIYYSTDNDYIQQHLSLFFNEFFFKSSKPLIDVFCDLIEIIIDNHKVFIDQCLYWIQNSNYLNGSQYLFYYVSLFLFKNYETIETHKLYFYVLDKIQVSSTWDKILTKKIIHLITQIIKKRPRENAHALLTRLMEIDDGFPMDQNEFENFIKSI